MIHHYIYGSKNILFGADHFVDKNIGILSGSIKMREKP